MGTRSSKYTRFKLRTPDPQLLNEEAIEELGSLLVIAGTGSGKAHPSTRRERRAAAKMLKYHVRTVLGLTKDYGRINVPPKFPSRLIPSTHDTFWRTRLHGDDRNRGRK